MDNLFCQVTTGIKYYPACLTKRSMARNNIFFLGQGLGHGGTGGLGGFSPSSRENIRDGRVPAVFASNSSEEAREDAGAVVRNCTRA